MRNIPDEALALKNKRVGERTACVNCKHAYPTKVNLMDTLLMCHALPPDACQQAILNQKMEVTSVITAALFVARPVPADYWCSLFELAPDKTDG